MGTPYRESDLFFRFREVSMRNNGVNLFQASSRLENFVTVRTVKQNVIFLENILKFPSLETLKNSLVTGSQDPCPKNFYIAISPRFS